MNRRLSFQDWIWLALLAVLLAPLPSQAQEIDRVGLDGGVMDIIILDTFFQPLKLTLEDRDGNPVDSAWLDPAPEAQTVSLNPALSGLLSRGWQHRLTLTDGEGALLDEMLFRFGLDCDGDLSLCDFILREGVSAENALLLTPELASYLEDIQQVPGTVLELGDLMADEPSLGGIGIEILVDVSRMANADGGCQCMFTFENDGGGVANGVADFVNDQLHYRTDIRTIGPRHVKVWNPTESTSEVDLACFETLASTDHSIQTSSGELNISLPTLAPCSGGCVGQVNWTLGRANWRSFLQSESDSTVGGGYDLYWDLDGTQILDQQDSWSISGTLMGPWIQSGSLVPQSGWTSQIPSEVRFKGSAWIELDGWPDPLANTGGNTAVSVAYPEGQMKVRSPIRAQASAICADSAGFSAKGTYSGPRPGSINLTVGPIDP